MNLKLDFKKLEGKKKERKEKRNENVYTYKNAKDCEILPLFKCSREKTLMERFSFRRLTRALQKNIVRERSMIEQREKLNQM